MSSSSEMPDHQDSQFTELISTLPKQCLDGDSMYAYQYQGFWYTSLMLAGVVSAQRQFQALPSDIFIGGSPKTGNTWLKSLCFAIASRKQYPHSQQAENPLLSNLSHSLVPVLELEYPKNPIIRNDEQQQNMNTPLLLSTHLPYTSLPESILSVGCKIIYICREPKDTFVSMFHYARRLQFLSASPESKEKDTFDLTPSLNLFCEGRNVPGPYWEHVLGYYKASLDRPNKIMFLKYEKLKADTELYVKELAAFMEVPFSPEEEAEGIPEKIVKLCSFQSLSGLETNKTGKFCRVGVQVDHRAFFRKGNVGDWKDELNPEMAEKIDRITEEKLKGSNFSFS